VSAVLERLTAAGPAAVAVLALRGEGAERVLAAAFRTRRGGRLARFEAGRVHVGEIDGADEVVVSRAEDGFEICGHGGPAAVARIERALAARGARVAAAAAPPLGALEAARTWLAFRVLAARDAGRLGAGWEGVVEALVRPRRVVLAGAPNAGKSSLFNALLERDRAIVSPEAGTTRDVIEEECALEGVPIVLCDAAGVRAGPEGAGAIERAAAVRARRAAALADIVLAVIDRAAPDLGVLEGLDPGRALVVVSKADLGLPLPPGVPEGSISASAVTGEGLDALALAIARRALGRDPRALEIP
jgi:tRNA modification GTPase